ncbi:hypothetical protein Dimus_008668 [Dionaea muscipula]
MQSLQAVAICDLLLQLCDVVAIGRRAAVDERCPVKNSEPMVLTGTELGDGARDAEPGKICMKVLPI